MTVEALATPVKGLFQYPHLAFPAYQRPFVWDKKAETLLTALHEACEAYDSAEGTCESYFIGNFLFVRDMRSGNQSPDVADGQQRMTTLYITLALLAERLRGYVCPEARKQEKYCMSLLVKSPDYDLEESYLQSVKPAVSQFLLKIAQAGTGADVYSKENPAPAEFNAYLGVLRKVKAWINDTLSTKEAVSSFTRFLLNNVCAVIIIYPSTATAIQAFENLNAGGESLVPADLLKSEFMKGSPSTEWAGIDEQWEKIIKGASSRKNGLSGFLRKAIMATIADAGKIPKISELLSSIQAEMRVSQQSATQVLTKIGRFADAVRAFSEMEPRYLAGDAGPVLSRLRRLPSCPEFVSTMVGCIPEGLTLAEREAIARAVEALACHIALCKKSKNINYVVQPHCVNLRQLKSGAEVPDFCTKLLSDLVAPLTDAFITAVAALRIKGSSDTDGKWAKYLLHIVEHEIRAGLGDTALHIGKEKLEVEHLLAQAFIGEFSEAAVYNLGNCTLLEKSKNSSLGKKRFVDKKSVYPSSLVRMTRELAGLNHGVNTAERKFLNQPEIQAVVNYADFDEASVALRRQGLMQVLSKCWSFGGGASPAEAQEAPEAPEAPPSVPVQVQLDTEVSIQPLSLTSKSKMVVYKADGKEIFGKNAAEVLVATLVHVGLERVERLQPEIKLSGVKLVSTTPGPTDRRSHAVGGYFVATHSDTPSKVAALKKVSAALNAGLWVYATPG